MAHKELVWLLFGCLISANESTFGTKQTGSTRLSGKNIATCLRLVKYLHGQNFLEVMTFPFHSCPIEILQTIFEYDALSEDKPLKASVTLSHVCWSWRRTALATPRLWATIVLKLSRSRPLINSIWNEMTKRAGSMPLVIEIQACQFALRDSLPHNFEQACAIESLSLHLGDFIASQGRVNCFQELEKLAFPIPRCAIQHLSVVCHWIYEYETSWALDSWLRKWPSVQSLEFRTSIPVHFADKLPFRDIKSLNLEGDGIYSLHDINNLFPNLDMLEFCGISRRDSPSTIIFPHLKVLRFRDIQGEVAWESVSCPKLVTFRPPKNEHPPSLYRFLQAHPSIKCLEVWWINQDIFCRISESAPQVTSLQLDGIFALSPAVEWVDSNSAPLFPNLEELVISHRLTPILIDGFDSFVIARCLPIQHHACRRMQGVHKQIKTLAIRLLDSPPPSSWIPSLRLGGIKDMKVILSSKTKRARYKLQWTEDEEHTP